MRKTTKKAPLNKIWYMLPIVAVVLFVVLACLNLRTAVWYDEAYSAYLIRGDFSDIWRMTAIDVHPPIYYFCLKIWSLLFGSTDFVLRLMSVFFAATGIILAYFWLKRYFSVKEAGIASVALSVSPLLMRYSQEMRMYGLVFAIVMGATLTLDVALRSKKKLAWLIYALLICLGMWTHYFSALAWLTHLVLIVCYFKKHGLQKAIFWVYPLAVVLFLPWLPYFWQQSHSIQQGFWIDPVDATTLMRLLTETLIFHDPAGTESWLLILLLATLTAVGVLFVMLWKKIKKEDRRKMGVLLMMAFLPPVLLMLLSMEPMQSTYMTRYVVYGATLLWPAVAILIYWAWTQKKHMICGIAATLMIICAVVGVATIDTRNTPGDNDAKEIMAQIIERGEMPVFIHVGSQHYYDLIFYETEENPVEAVDVGFEWGSLEPIREYTDNYVGDQSVIMWDNDEFWLITENGNDYHFEDYDYELGEKIENSMFTAQEYKRAAE